MLTSILIIRKWDYMDGVKGKETRSGCITHMVQYDDYCEPENQ